VIPDLFQEKRGKKMKKGTEQAGGQEDKSFVKGIIAGMQEIRSSNGGEYGHDVDSARMKTVVDVLRNSFYDDLSLNDETVGEMMSAVKQYYFQGHGGSFHLAKIFREQTESGRRTTKINFTEGRPKAAILKMVDLICADLRMAKQIGHLAMPAMESAFWVAEQIYLFDGQAADRLLRACGSGLLGEEIDQFFWKLKGQGQKMSWATRPLAQGMANRDIVEIFSSHLLKKGRGPQIEEDRPQGEI